MYLASKRWRVIRYFELTLAGIFVAFKARNEIHELLELIVCKIAVTYLLYLS